MRIVSLLASATEIVCALGAGDNLVGRSHECDNPDWVRSLPPCSEPAFDISGSSHEIDAEVKRLEKQKAEKEKALQAVRSKLANASFVERAPADVVAQQRAQETELTNQIQALLQNLAHLAWAEEFMLAWILKRPAPLPKEAWPADLPCRCRRCPGQSRGWARTGQAHPRPARRWGASRSTR